MKLGAGRLITDFFSAYLVNEAGLSYNTVKSYRDSFILFFKYLDESGTCRPEKLALSVFTSDNINRFLDWIERERLCSVNTRNQRLAALKTFCNYVIRRAPENCDNCQGVLKIRSKKAPHAVVDYLSVEAVVLLLRQPCKDTDEGSRDLALLTMMYESGCRVQELIDVRLGDISAQSPHTVKIAGKGKKGRIIPVSANAADILRVHVKNNNISAPEQVLFVNRQGRTLTRSGVAYILDKYTAMAREKNPELFGKDIHPHVMRHSKAMHMLENGVNLIYIRDFLGHSSVTVTEIYARCNPELKRRYMEQLEGVIGATVEPYSDTEKESLLSWLRDNI
jgi:site-specific recombinase XerD